MKIDGLTLFRDKSLHRKIKTKNYLRTEDPGIQRGSNSYPYGL